MHINTKDQNRERKQNSVRQTDGNKRVCARICQVRTHAKV